MLIMDINKAKILVTTLNADEAIEAPEERWTYKLVPMPCGEKAKIEVIDQDGVFVAYMGQELTVWDWLKVA